MATISKKNLALLHATAKDFLSGFNLNKVRVKDGKLWASNGNHLYSSRINNEHSGFPDCGIPGAEDKAEMVFSASLLKNSKIPTKKFLPPALYNIDVLVDGAGKTHAVTTDLDSTTTHNEPTTSVNDWPNIETMIEAIEKQKPERKVACLAVSELEILVKVMKAHGGETCKIEVGGRNEPVKVLSEDGLLEGYIMPYYVP